jgi:hypothetical protein
MNYSSLFFASSVLSFAAFPAFARGGLAFTDARAIPAGDDTVGATPMDNAFSASVQGVVTPLQQRAEILQR